MRKWYMKLTIEEEALISCILMFLAGIFCGYLVRG